MAKPVEKRVLITEYDIYELEDIIKALFAGEEAEIYKPEGYYDIEVEANRHSWDDDKNATIEVYGVRMETPLEAEAREKEKERMAKGILEADRRLYEQLKKKFEPEK